VLDRFTETVRLPGAPEDVWRVVEDVPVVLSWISIVHSTAPGQSPDRYAAVLQDRLGPFKLRADLRIDVLERDAGHRIRARAEGEDRQIGSRLIIEVTLKLTEDGGTTVLTVDGSYEVTGRPATLGASSIRKKAGKVIAEFFASAERALAPAAA
jgi:carbon monoxide dehydrogenase subunit G